MRIGCSHSLNNGFLWGFTSIYFSLDLLVGKDSPKRWFDQAWMFLHTFRLWSRSNPGTCGGLWCQLGTLDPNSPSSVDKWEIRPFPDLIMAVKLHFWLWVTFFGWMWINWGILRNLDWWTTLCKWIWAPKQDPLCLPHLVKNMDETVINVKLCDILYHTNETMIGTKVLNWFSYHFCT